VTLPMFDTQREEWLDLDALYPEPRPQPKREAPPSLPHTCSDCGAHFKQGEADALREHQRLCRAWAGRIPVYPEGTQPPSNVPHNFHSWLGYSLKGDRADIWRLWVENGRRGAEQLIDRHGAKRLEPADPIAPLHMLGDPDPPKLARHVKLYGREGAEAWLEGGDGTPDQRDARTVYDVVLRRSGRSRRSGMIRRAKDAKLLRTR
jgi:hypothetical protein